MSDKAKKALKAKKAKLMAEVKKLEAVIFRHVEREKKAIGVLFEAEEALDRANEKLFYLEN
jgi:hypothetical protein